MTGDSAGQTVAPRRSLLRHRDFRLLWIGQTTSKLGSSVTGVALPLVAVATVDATTFQVALLAAAAWVPWLVIGLPAGAWVDRLPRRPVMILADLACLVLFLSVPVAAWFGVLGIGQLLAVALGTGTASVFFQTSYQVYLPTLLRPEEVAEGNAKLQGTESAAHVVGPGLAGLLAQLVGAASALLADAASFLVSVLCLWSIRTPEARPAPDPHRENLRRQIRAGIRFVALDPYLRVMTVFGAASNIALVGYQAILVVFLVREVGVSPGLVGALIALTSLGGVLGATAAGWLARRFGTARGLLLSELGAAPFALLIPLTAPGPRLGFLVAGGVVVGAGIVAGNVIKGSFRQTYTPHHLLGRVTVSMQLLNFGSIPFGALLAGALGTTAGIRPTMWIMTALLPLSSLILLVGPLRQRRDLPTLPPGDDRDQAVDAAGPVKAVGPVEAVASVEAVGGDVGGVDPRLGRRGPGDQRRQQTAEARRDLHAVPAQAGQPEKTLRVRGPADHRHVVGGGRPQPGPGVVHPADGEGGGLLDPGRADRDVEVVGAYVTGRGRGGVGG